MDRQLAVLIPWTRGFMAQRAGKPEGANPHEPESPAWRSWLKGWRSAADTQGEPTLPST